MNAHVNEYQYKHPTKAIQYTGTNFQDVYDFCPHVDKMVSSSNLVIKEAGKHNVVIAIGDYLVDDYRTGYFVCHSDNFDEIFVQSPKSNKSSKPNKRKTNINLASHIKYINENNLTSNKDLLNYINRLNLSEKMKTRLFNYYEDKE